MPKKLSGKEIGETSFMVGYLLFLLVAGIIAYTEKNYFLVILIMFLGIGDSFHLIPRIIKNVKGDFKNSDFFLGLGNQVSSITMTIFYIVLICSTLMALLTVDDHLQAVTPSLGNTLKDIFSTIWSYIADPNFYLLGSVVVYLALIRIILCLFPNNNWYSKEGNFTWSIIRNIPFTIIGLIIAIMFIVEESYYLGILIILSFLFYLPVALFAKKNPKLGMLMIPKTICYILMIIYFL